MTSPWKVAPHDTGGWAIYRRAARGQRAYRLPREPGPLTFADRRAAAIWAEILNELEAARAASRAARRG